MVAGSASTIFAKRRHRHSQIDNLCRESIVEPLDPTAGVLRCGGIESYRSGMPDYESSSSKQSDVHL
jgi:hypothetical protein